MPEVANADDGARFLRVTFLPLVGGKRYVAEYDAIRKVVIADIVASVSLLGAIVLYVVKSYG